MLLDAHAHLDEYEAHELPAMLAALEEHDIVTLSVAMDLPSFVSAEAISRQSRHVVPGMGVHPWVAPDHVDHLHELDDAFARSPFIGEIGLDHRWVTDETLHPAQRIVFEHQLQVALAEGKLVNVHCSGAERQAVEIMGALGVERAIIHWYSGPHDVLRAMADLGFFFTVGVEVLHSEAIRDVASTIPGDLLLTETDNPAGLEWLTGERPTPLVLREVIDELSRIRGTSPTEMRHSIEANFTRMIAEDAHLRPRIEHRGGD